MKTTPRLLAFGCAALLGAATALAQTTPTTPPTTTTPTTTPPANSGRPGNVGRPDNPGNPVVRPTTPPTATPPVVRPTTPPATPPAAPPAGRGNASPHTPNENASDTAKAVMTVIRQFDLKRDQAMAERKALIDQLAAAKTETERQTIITQLRSETQAEREQQATLGKQIREELRKLREERRSGGG